MLLLLRGVNTSANVAAGAGASVGAVRVATMWTVFVCAGVVSPLLLSAVDVNFRGLGVNTPPFRCGGVRTAGRAAIFNRKLGGVVVGAGCLGVMLQRSINKSFMCSFVSLGACTTIGISDMFHVRLVPPVVVCNVWENPCVGWASLPGCAADA